MIFDKLITRLLSEGHKVLVFSFFKNMLDIMEDYFRMKVVEYTRLDGEYGLETRDENITTF